MGAIRLALAQVNPTVGDFGPNTNLIVRNIERARAQGVDVIAFPELAIPGYPPEDLLLKPKFIEENRQALDRVIAASSGIGVICGFVDQAQGGLYNAAAVIYDRKLVDIYHKILLPNYGVFDENRYFRPGARCPVYRIGGVNIGLNICEDIWFSSGPTAKQAAGGSELVVNISASPYHYNKRTARESLLGQRAAENRVCVAYCNMVGGQDELVFDGGSVVFNAAGQMVARATQFAEDLLVVDLSIDRGKDTILAPASGPGDTGEGSDTELIEVSAPVPSAPLSVVSTRIEPAAEPTGEIYRALLLGLKDYIGKNGFKKVVIGLSGGIDSALVAALAAAALGAPNVTGVIMPSRYSAPSSAVDAALLAANLQMKTLTIPIEPVFQTYLDSLAPAFSGMAPNTTEENIQARIRGNFLMALSNKFGWIVLTTGNKSEMATGYSTLYGDMAGGFAVIKDIYKMTVYRLCHYINALAGCDVIPRQIIDKAPTAELRPNQKDADTLPPYAILDPILVAYIEEDKSLEQVVDMGFERDTVKRVAKLVDLSEYKRRQAPPGIKITPKAFGRDRRLPITNRFRQGE